MAYKYSFNCLKVLSVLIFMLFFQLAKAQYNFSKLDNWLADNVANLGGRVVLMIYKDGKIIYENSVNELSAKQKRINQFIAKRKGVTFNQENFTSTTQMRIASSSKWLTAALVMTFVDEGKLQTTDTIGKYLPIFTQYGKGHITISQCLSHTTGIYQQNEKEGIKTMTSFKTMDDAILFLAKEKMEGLPGKTFHYGNAGLQIAAAIMEKISGKSFELLFAERLAKPLNMPNTHFGKKELPLAAGGAFSTTQDYMNFLVMILNKGKFNGKQILSANALNEMQLNRINKHVIIKHSPARNKPTAYGYGLWIDEAADNTAKAISSPGLFGSLPVVDVKNNYCFYLATLNLQYKERQDRYEDLKKMIDTSLGF